MSYQRAQIIPALWTAFAGHFRIPTVPLKLVPKKFVRRVGNFLDRGIGITPDRRAGQKGVFQEYELEDVVELGVSLSLQNIGLPQSDIVSFVLNFREAIRTQISSAPLSPDRTFPRILVVQPRGLEETQRAHGPMPKFGFSGIPFYEPVFINDARHWESFATEIGNISNGRIVIDIGDLVTSINLGLASAESSNRGRQ